MEMHGGQVEAQSAGIDHGATFTLRFPALDEDVREGTPGMSDKALINKLEA